MRAASPAKLDSFHADVFPNTVGSDEAKTTARLWYENTTYGAAVNEIYQAHYRRIVDDEDASISDGILRKLLA